MKKINYRLLSRIYLITNIFWCISFYNCAIENFGIAIMFSLIAAVGLAIIEYQSCKYYR